MPGSRWARSCPLASSTTRTKPERCREWPALGHGTSRVAAPPGGGYPCWMRFFRPRLIGACALAFFCSATSHADAPKGQRSNGWASPATLTKPSPIRWRITVSKSGNNRERHVPISSSGGSIRVEEPGWTCRYLAPRETVSRSENRRNEDMQIQCSMTGGYVARTFARCSHPIDWSHTAGLHPISDATLVVGAPGSAGTVIKLECEVPRVRLQVEWD